MITRRRVVAGSTGALLLASVAGRHAFGAAEAAAEPLIALPGKQPLIRRTFRPPNYETPLAQLRPQLTANDSFFVRYHLASIPEVDARTWRLRIGGASVQRPLELSLDELKRDFERVRLARRQSVLGQSPRLVHAAGRRRPMDLRRDGQRAVGRSPTA